MYEYFNGIGLLCVCVVNCLIKILFGFFEELRRRWKNRKLKNSNFSIGYLCFKKKFLYFIDLYLTFLLYILWY